MHKWEETGRTNDNGKLFKCKNCKTIKKQFLFPVYSVKLNGENINSEHKIYAIYFDNGKQMLKAPNCIEAKKDETLNLF